MSLTDHSSGVLCHGILLLSLHVTCGAFHLTAGYFGVHFFSVLRRFHEPRAPLKVLEVGSQDVNGGLRSYAPRSWEYIGGDLAPGNGVDIVLEDPYHYPFASEEFDLVVSNAAFEHTDFFWLAFLEMLRVVHREGHIYIMIPSTTRDHGDMVPPDSWRFLKDAGSSLAKWGVLNGYADLRVLQSFVGERVPYQHHEDCIMIFTRRGLFYNGTEDDLQKIPTSPPATFPAARDFILSSHRCWQDLTPTQKATRWEFNIPELSGEDFGFASTCCLYIEENIHLRPDVKPTSRECWGISGRSYIECCPHIMTD